VAAFVAMVVVVVIGALFLVLLVVVLKEMTRTIAADLRRRATCYCRSGPSRPSSHLYEVYLFCENNS